MSNPQVNPPSVYEAAATGVAGLIETTGPVDVSNNTYTVTMTTHARLLWAHVIYTTVGAGTRIFEMAMLDPTDAEIIVVVAGATQAGSLAYHYNLMQGVFRETAAVAASLQVPFGKEFFIPAGYKLRFRDSAGISASDTMQIAYQLALE
jgi:hypothetical protein